jgi:hypothetical protein
MGKYTDCSHWRVPEISGLDIDNVAIDYFSDIRTGELPSSRDQLYELPHIV